MKRYIAFLDILGFSHLVENEQLAVVKHKLQLALQSLHLAKHAGKYPKLPAKNAKSFHCFSFSDTFVLASDGDSLEALVPFLIGAALLTQYLFAQGLPVRGAITYGEADFIPGTNHLIGKAIIAAHALEKEQDWLGVIVDLPSMPHDAPPLFEYCSVFSPLFVRWDVPMKNGQTLGNALVVNWRFNLVVEKGIKSLFRTSECDRANRKINNTLTFAKHLRDNGNHEGSATVFDEQRQPMKIPWLAGCTVSAKDPRTGVTHGDEY